VGGCALRTRPQALKDLSDSQLSLRLLTRPIRYPFGFALQRRSLGVRQRIPVRYCVRVKARDCWIFGWGGAGGRPIEVWYAASSSAWTASSWRRSKPVIVRPRQRSAARIMAPYISFRTAFSPNALGMILRRRRSSRSSRSSRFVVRGARRWVIGKRRWAMQASNSFWKQARRSAARAHSRRPHHHAARGRSPATGLGSRPGPAL
jgi:hypothetical protein